ncbi:MAG: M1 family metallopeptidase [Erythrobacter sp.]|nr:M1 family metallopeptidase [Erythrobacter sp.]
MRASILTLALAATLAMPAAAHPDTGDTAADDAQAPPLAARTADSGLPLTAAQEATGLPFLDLRLKVDPASKSIEGDARYTIEALAPLDRFEVDLDPRFAITSITVDGAPATWESEAGQLSIPLGKTLAKGETAKVAIEWNGQPHVARRAPWDGGFVWDQTEDGQPWVATAVQMNGCDLFWPCIDYPTKEIARLDSAITVPEGLVAAGNGVAAGSETKDGWTTWKWSTRNPNTYAIALNIAPYGLLEESYQSRFGNSIPLYFWYLPGNEAKARTLLQEVKTYLDFFEEVIGPYPFADEKVGLAETPHLGMEHQTINAYGAKFRQSPLGYDSLAQHEFSHEWFANQLTNKAPNDMWLHEGLGSYMQPLFQQWRDGQAAYIAAIMAQRPGVLSRSPVVPAQPISQSHYLDDDAGWGRDIYSKGSQIAHTLRALIGDEAFFSAIRRLTYGRSDPKPGNFVPQFADTADFQRIAGEESGRDLGWFFDAYLRQAALPKLIEQRDGSTLMLRWKTDGGTPFPMPVDVRVGDRTIVADMSSGTARVDLGSDDAHYVIDPDYKVLRYSAEIARWQEWAAEQEAKARAEREAAAKAAKDADAAQ